MKSFFNEVKNNKRLVEQAAELTGCSAEKLMKEVLGKNGNINSIT